MSTRRERYELPAALSPPTHDGPCVESLDGDDKPLGYCVTCYQPLTCCIDARKADPKKEWTWHEH